MAILKALRVGDTMELKPNGARWLKIPGHKATGKFSGWILETEAGTDYWLWLNNSGVMKYHTSEPATHDLGVTVGGAAATDATLLSISALGTGADKMLYTTGVDTWAELAVTSYGRSILDDTSEAVFKATVNLEIGTDVQAYDANLTTFAGIAPAANMQTWLAVADYATMRSTLGLEIAVDVATYAHNMSTHGDEDTYNINTSGTLGAGNATLGTIAAGNTVITGTGSFSGLLTTTLGIASASHVWLNADSLELRFGAVNSDSNIKFDGTDLQFYDTSAGSYSLTELAASGGLSPTVAGDLTISDGSLTITDADNAATVAVVNDFITSSDMVTLSASGVLTGAMLHIDADGLTTGQFVEFDDNGVQFAVKLGGEIEITGVTDSDMFTIAAGNFLMQDGTLNITDADNDTLVTLVNDSVTSADVISLSADAVTSGCLLHLSNSVGGTFTGEYIQCYDGSGDDFSVKLHGVTAIAGNAITNPALTLTTGDFIVTDGNLRVDMATSDAAAGHIFNSDDDGTSAIPLLQLISTVVTNDQPLLQLDSASTGDVNTLELVNDGTGYSISASLVKTDAMGLEILYPTGGTNRAIYVDGATGTFVGAAGEYMVHIQQTGTLANAVSGALFVDFDGDVAAGSVGYGLNIDDENTTTGGGEVLASINSKAAIALWVEGQATGINTMVVEATGSGTVAAVKIDGATNDWAGANDHGMLHLTSDANLGNAGSTMLLVATDNVIDAAEGGLARFVDTAAAGGTLSNAVEIASSNNYALNVSAGFARFAKGIVYGPGNAYDVTDLGAPPSQADLVTMFGAAGEQGATYIYDDNDAGTSVYLVIDDGGDYHYILSTQPA